jgi:inner membrane protein
MFLDSPERITFMSSYDNPRPPPIEKKPFISDWTLKIIGLVLLSLLLLIPLGLISSMITEREQLLRQVTDEIGREWGAPQTLGGPVLMIPYTYQGQEKNTVHIQEIVLPTYLKMDHRIQHDFRHRSLYRSLVYEDQAHIQGRFHIDQTWFPAEAQIQWDRSLVVLPISDNRGIIKVKALINGQNVRSESGTRLLLEASKGETSSSGSSNNHLTTFDILSKGIHLLPASHQPFGPGKDILIDIELSLKGSHSLKLLPFGEESIFKVVSDWPHPSFKDLLPLQKKLTSQGFEAEWKANYLSRNYPQHFQIVNGRVNASYLGEIQAETILYEPVSSYAKIERSVKYGALFIVLTIGLILLFQIGSGRALHSVQYLIIGGTLALFYLILLSLSEHLSFAWSYLWASLFVVVSITAYIQVALGDRKRSGIIALLLIALFLVLYSILHLEDYALLMGTALLCALLLISMYLTRHINEE